MRASLLIDYPMLLPEENMYDYDHYIKGLSKEQLITFAVFLISVNDFSQDNTELNFNFLLNWFGSENADYAHFINEKVKKLIKEGNKNYQNRNFTYRLFNPVTGLRLIEKLLTINISTPENTVNQRDININIFKLLLLLNTEFNKEISINGLLESTEITDKPLAWHITLAMPVNEILNANFFTIVYSFTTQFAKSCYLLDFLELRDIELLNKFLKKYSCNSIQQYKNFFTSLIDKMFNENSGEKDYLPSPKTFSIPKTEIDLKNFIDNFLIELNLAESSFAEQNDFQYLRSYPILKYDDENYCIINKLFVVQKLYNGLYFELSKIYDEMRPQKKGQFRSDFSYYFTEKYLLYKLMNETYGKRSYLQFSGDEISDYIEGGPDFYLRNGKNIFIFENKDIFISGKVKMSYDFHKIKSIIDDRLVTNKKGIPQLIKNIKKYYDNKFIFDKNHETKNSVIYPLLVTHRSEFDTAGLNYYLNIEFKKQLDALRLTGYDVKKVKNLTVINIDILILFKYILKDKKTTLNEMIESYQKKVNPVFIRAKNEIDLEEKKSQIYVPFSDYILAEFSLKNTEYADEMRKWIKEKGQY